MAENAMLYYKKGWEEVDVHEENLNRCLFIGINNMNGLL